MTTLHPDNIMEGKLQSSSKVIVITCNWNAYSGLETAGTERLTYSSSVHPIKVMCLGQISPGIILKAFEKGANGVLMLGCPPGECQFEFGNRRAEEIYKEVKELVALLGYREEQFKLDWIAAREGQTFVDVVGNFVDGLNGSANNDA
ncbi:MAG: hydrogenase iron-sulfur subunit [Anaerolineales bacterium]|nr:hydrogenase iron-sulfur subunit [Chloroflexota bacterium]MBL6980329.1 hydrogenase iron-sulfur subunit [Anaerolineales bacterium]